MYVAVLLQPCTNPIPRPCALAVCRFCTSLIPNTQGLGMRLATYTYTPKCLGNSSVEKGNKYLYYRTGGQGGVDFPP